MRRVLSGARIFDGERFHDGQALVIEDNRIVGLIPASQAPQAERVSGTLAPAFLDLQVNGGGGHLLSGATTTADLATVCAAHRRLGCAGVLPTLITDSFEATGRMIQAGIAAARDQTPGFLGLHLEGPHLDPRRKGAHDAAFIRPMTGADLDRLCEAARALPALMVTLAPEAASPDQVATLASAGVIVSLGHTDCSYDLARSYFAAGARAATHLFNAMSQMGHRSPGLAGAVLAGDCAAGLIADGIHVHPAVMQIALAARSDGLFLITDCMAFAGTDLTEMELNGRRVLRRDGRLTLNDGTLAGADLTLDQAIARLIGLGADPARALAMATRIPARLIGHDQRLGAIAPGHAAELVLLDDDWRLARRWSGADWL